MIFLSQESFTTPTKLPPTGNSVPESPLFPQYQTPQKSYHAPSDTESEMEEPVTSLDNYSKEELFQKFRKMERNLTKYRGRCTEVCKDRLSVCSPARKWQKEDSHLFWSGWICHFFFSYLITSYHQSLVILWKRYAFFNTRGCSTNGNPT